MSKPAPLDVHEAPGLLARSVKELAVALDGLPDASKSAYMEAMAVAPELVNTESMPEWFLRVEGFNVEMAALRLASYWTERKAAFGAERAFLSLSDMSGRGALSDDDLRVLQMKFFQQLPDDAQGRAVIISDLMRVGANYSTVKPGAFRVFFHIMLIVSKHPTAQTDGIVGLRVMKEPKFNRDLLKRCLTLCVNTFPIRFHRYHVCCLPPPQSRKYFTDVVAPIIVKAASECFLEDCPVHVAETEAGMLLKLQPYDLVGSGLPKSLGGTWLYEGEESIEGHAQSNSRNRKNLANDASESRKRPKYEQPAATASPNINVDLVLQSLSKLRDASQFGSVKDVLNKPAIRRRVMVLINPPSPQAVAKARPVARIDNKALAVKEELKKRLLKKMLARGTQQREKPTRLSRESRPSPLRASLVARVLERLALQKPQKELSTAAPTKKLVGAAVSESIPREMREYVDKISNEEKAAYVKACEVAPHLVLEESKPEWFLRVEHNDACAAARRLVFYWKERRAVFGDRAFLPLSNISGDGALSKDDVGSMNSGCFVQLPQDSKGRLVFLSNLATLNAEVQEARFLAWRLMFYWALVISDNPSVQRPGIAVLHVVSENKLNGSFLERSFGMFQYAIPVRFGAYHFCGIPASEGRNHFKKIVAPLALHSTGGFMADRVTFHLADSPSEMMKTLEKHGFVENGVPLCLGGTFAATSESKNVSSSRNTETTNPSSVLKALKALQKSKNCTMHDLMKMKGVQKQVFALLKPSRPLDHTRSKVSSEVVSTPGSLGSKHKAFSADHEQTELKTRLLSSVLGRFREGVNASSSSNMAGKPLSAMRKALTTKVVQELVSRRATRSVNAATNGSSEVSSQMLPVAMHSPTAVADVLRALQLARERKDCSFAELITKRSVQAKAKALVNRRNLAKPMPLSLANDARSSGNRADTLQTKTQLIENVLQRLKSSQSLVPSSVVMKNRTPLRNALNDLVLQKIIEKRK